MDKQYKQKTSLKSFKTEIKILALIQRELYRALNDPAP